VALVLAAVFAASGGAALGAMPVAAADPAPSPDPGASTNPPDATPTPPAATPSPPPVALPPLVFTQSTYRANAFVPQFTSKQCVGASIQTMRNQVAKSRNRTRSAQRTYWLRARSASKYKGDGGADPFGWAAALRSSASGVYAVVAEPTLAAALWVGAKLMRATHRPVGTLVWNGAHAWSLSGFETSADPASTDDFTVTAVYPNDPLYPYYPSRRWPVVKPHQRMAVSRVATYLTRYRDPRLDPLIQNLFVMIVPIGPDGIVPTPPAALLAPPPPPPPPPPNPTPTPTPTPTPSPSGDPGASTQGPGPSSTPVDDPAGGPPSDAPATPAATPTPTPTPSASPSPTPTPAPPDDPTPAPS
jgi:hypothetical protein